MYHPGKKKQVDDREGEERKKSEHKIHKTGDGGERQVKERVAACHTSR